MAEPFAGKPLFDIASYARRGPGHRDQFSLADLEQIRRTVARVPEVMVKVLPRAASTVAAVERHVEYVGRDGDVPLETDDGQRLDGDDAGKRLATEWDLDLPAAGSAEGAARGNPQAPRLAHKIVFSMPPGAPAPKVLAAVQDFAREEFALSHRYAMALHTDEAHPHVHVIVKAVSEQGVRLNIKKPVLRRWRAEFARHLRAHGVEANATERAVRGKTEKTMKDGLFRMARRGQPPRAEPSAREPRTDGAAQSRTRPAGPEPPLPSEVRVMAAYAALAKGLAASGHPELGVDVLRFAQDLAARASERRKGERKAERGVHSGEGTAAGPTRTR